MRRSVAAIVVAAATFPGLAAGSSPAAGTGWLIGRTQISFGCPGPVTPDGETCNPWRAFAHARFAVALARADGTPIAGTSHVVVSDEQGRFRIPFAAGDYAITPLAQGHARGGSKVRVHVFAGRTTWALVRFYGFPQMV